MTNIIDKYRILLLSVPRLIEVSGYSAEIRHDTCSFFSKKSKGYQTIDEVEKILKNISNEDVEDFLDDMVFEKRFPGKFINSKQFEKRMEWK